MSRSIVWGNKTGIKKFFLIIFWLWKRKFQTFPQKFPAELSERLSMYPENEFQEKVFFGSIYLYDFPRLRAEVCSCEEFFAGLSIMHFTCPKGVLGGESSFEIYALKSRTSSDKRCGVIAENLAVGLSKPTPKRPDDPIGEKIFLKVYRFFVFGLWAVTFRTLGKKLLAAMPKLPSTCPEEFFKWKKIAKKIVFRHFLILNCLFSSLQHLFGKNPSTFFLATGRNWIRATFTGRLN